MLVNELNAIRCCKALFLIQEDGETIFILFKKYFFFNILKCKHHFRKLEDEKHFFKTLYFEKSHFLNTRKLQFTLLLFRYMKMYRKIRPCVLVYMVCTHSPNFHIHTQYTYGILTNTYIVYLWHTLTHTVYRWHTDIHSIHMAYTHPHSIQMAYLQMHTQYTHGTCRYVEQKPVQNLIGRPEP